MNGSWEACPPTVYDLRFPVYDLRAMAEHGKCPMGNHPWLATFFALAFILVFVAHKLGLL